MENKGSGRFIGFFAGLLLGDVIVAVPGGGFNLFVFFRFLFALRFRLRIKEGSRFTDLELDPETATAIGQAPIAWASENDNDPS